MNLKTRKMMLQEAKRICKEAKWRHDGSTAKKTCNEFVVVVRGNPDSGKVTYTIRIEDDRLPASKRVFEGSDFDSIRAAKLVADESLSTMILGSLYQEVEKDEAKRSL